MGSPPLLQLPPPVAQEGGVAHYTTPKRRLDPDVEENAKRIRDERLQDLRNARKDAAGCREEARETVYEMKKLLREMRSQIKHAAPLFACPVTGNQFEEVALGTDGRFYEASLLRAHLLKYSDRSPVPPLVRGRPPFPNCWMWTATGGIGKVRCEMWTPFDHLRGDNEEAETDSGEDEREE